MAQTTALICEHLPIVLASEILAYFDNTDDFERARSGLWEYCKNITKFEIGLRGACYAGNLSVAKMMIKKGAKKLHRGIKFACYGDQPAIVKYLIDIYGAKRACIGSIQMLCQSDSIESVKIFLDKGIDRNRLFVCAVLRGNYNIVKYMVDLGEIYVHIRNLNGVDKSLNILHHAWCSRHHYVQLGSRNDPHIHTEYPIANINNFDKIIDLLTMIPEYRNEGHQNMWLA